jgi:hypothetical protein
MLLHWHGECSSSNIIGNLSGVEKCLSFCIVLRVACGLEIKWYYKMKLMWPNFRMIAASFKNGKYFGVRERDRVILRYAALCTARSNIQQFQVLPTE